MGLTFKKVPPRFELGSQDSESWVLTITPRGQFTTRWLVSNLLNKDIHITGKEKRYWTINIRQKSREIMNFIIWQVMKIEILLKAVLFNIVSLPLTKSLDTSFHRCNNKTSIPDKQLENHIPVGLVVRIRRSHRRGRGSIPRQGGKPINLIFHIKKRL